MNQFEYVDGDMFEEYLSPEVMYVVPTNGYVKNDKSAVMGKGLALDARVLQKGVDRILGDYILGYGNRCYLLPGNLVSFPTKTHWKERSDLGLIQRSATQLRDLWTYLGGTRRLFVPHVGCGNGGLSWFTVRPLIETALSGLPVTFWDYTERLK